MATTFLHLPESTKKKLAAGKITEAQAKEFNRFLQVIEKDFFHHPVIVNNPYTKWLKKGEITTKQLKDLITQWGIFSNHFLVVQCKRMVNARTEEAERGARWILANEIGVGLDVHAGSCDGKTFHTKNAHINWLRELAGMIDLNPRILGTWDHATPATREFLKDLDETYGSEDENIGAGASFGIESWAAFGIGKGKEAESDNFWQEHIAGLKAYNEKHRIPNGLPPLPLGFFQYHFQIEGGHGANVFNELEDTFFGENFNEAKYLEGGRKALKAIYAFWQGLDEARKKLN